LEEKVEKPGECHVATPFEVAQSCRSGSSINISQGMQKSRSPDERALHLSGYFGIICDAAAVN